MSMRKISRAVIAEAAIENTGLPSATDALLYPFNCLKSTEKRRYN